MRKLRTISKPHGTRYSQAEVDYIVQEKVNKKITETIFICLALGIKVIHNNIGKLLRSKERETLFADIFAKELSDLGNPKIQAEILHEANKLTNYKINIQL